MSTFHKVIFSIARKFTIPFYWWEIKITNNTHFVIALKFFIFRQIKQIFNIIFIRTWAFVDTTNKNTLIVPQ